MQEDTVFNPSGAISDALTELLRQGARGLIEQAVETELQWLLDQYANVTDLAGRRAIVRNGYLPERDILTGLGLGPVTVRREIQLGGGASLGPQSPAGGGRAAVAVPPGDIDGRSAGGVVGPSG